MSRQHCLRRHFEPFCIGSIELRGLEISLLGMLAEQLVMRLWALLLPPRFDFCDAGGETRLHVGQRALGAVMPSWLAIPSVGDIHLG